MTSSVLRAAVLLALVGPLGGCVSAEMNRLKRDVAADVRARTGAEAGGGFSMAFGRMSIGSARFLTRLVAPTASEEGRRYTRHVRSVKVARSGLSGPVDGRLLVRPAALERYERDGWLPLVTVRDSAAATWVLVRERERDGRLTDLLAVVVGGKDLVLTKVSGNLSQLLLDAMEDETGDVFGGALRHTGLASAPTAPPAGGAAPGDGPPAPR